jgi:serine/threonine protein kinase/WD40 repeat protein
VNSSSPDDPLLARLFDLPAVDRLAHWEKACAENPALRSRLPEIARILEKSDSAAPTSARDPLPQEHLMRALESALEPADRESVGSQIGPYKLLQKIGEGGFGSVWMAEQSEPFRRRVALKIVKVGMDTDEVIARFEIERQALALMDHPNIARVYDAGATASGRPYFVMELVRGVAITRYCDDNRLTAEERLRLLIAVCQAVQHAHQKGVIHRDLKPSNILVTLADGVPIPKVIDFGIAKATEKRLTEKTLVTQFHAFVGTPAYTSPEQMEMSALDIDTRSDIYSLGVLLYELLAGRPPFDPDALMKSGFEAMRRIIREVDPPRPSSRLGTLNDVDRTSVAHARGTDAAKLSVVLRGDLDWIVMRCLEKDRTRRYETANDLANDVQRFLADEPITARPPSNLYRLSKVARRHRVAFIATTIVVIAIVTALVVSSFLFWRERAAHARAEMAEKSEGMLRRKTASRAAGTALEQANREFDQGRVSDGLAWLVYAGANDPFHPVIAPRIASVLASHSFLLPDGAPFECGSRVAATRFAGDGRTFFVGTDDGTLRVFDAASGQVVRQVSLGQPVRRFGGFQFPRDNNAIFAARFDDNSIGVFDIVTGQPIAATIVAPDKRSPTDPHWSDAVGLSPSGRWAHSINWIGFHVWDVTTGELRIEFLWSGGSGITDFDFSADGRHVLLVIGRTVHVWSLPDGKPLEKPIMLPPGGGGTLAHFTPDGERVAVLERLVGVHLFGLDGTEFGETMPCTESVNRKAWGFMPDGRLLIAGEQTAQILNLTTRRATSLAFAWTGNFWTRDFNHDGTRLLTFDGDTARLWDTTTGTLAAEPTQQPSLSAQIALSPDGTRLVIGTASGGVQRLRLTPRPARPLELPGLRVPPMFFPQRPGQLMLLERGRARVIDFVSARELPGGFAFPHPVFALPSPDLGFLVARNPQGLWEAWELGPTGVRQAVALRDAPAENARVVISPAGDRVLLGTKSDFRVWDLRTGEAVGPRMANRPNAPNSLPAVQFSPDGEHVVLTGAGVANVLAIASGRELMRFEPLPNMMINYGVFSPDGTRVVTAIRGGEARLWDATTGAPISPVLHHPDIVKHPVFSSDGRFFATNTEREIRFWDGHTGAPLGDPLDVKDNHLVWLSPDNERVLVASRAGSARVWHVRSGQPVTEVMPHLPPNGGARFSPDGRFAVIDATPYHICSVPRSQPAGSEVPDWLLQLATALATKFVDENGKFQTSDTASLLQGARRALAALPADAPLAEWGRWILDERTDRPMAPGFTATEADAAKLWTALAPTQAKP